MFAYKPAMTDSIRTSRADMFSKERSFIKPAVVQSCTSLNC